MFTFPSSPKIYISLLPIFLFRSRLLFFHCFMARLHAQFYIGKKQPSYLYVELCRDEFKGGGFITFWVLENTKFHTFKKCIRKYLPCNVITSIDGWAAMLCFLCCILIKPIDQSKIIIRTPEPRIKKIELLIIFSQSS